MRHNASGLSFLNQLLHGRTERGTLDNGPIQSMRKGIGSTENSAEELHDALIAPAVACYDEAETVPCIDQTFGERGVLAGQIGWEILQTVVTKVAVKFAIDGKLFVVQGQVGVSGAFKVICGE